MKWPLDGEVMKMRQLADGLKISGPVEEVVSQARRLPLMFIGIDSQFQGLGGKTRTVKLTFEKAGSIEIRFRLCRIFEGDAGHVKKGRRWSHGPRQDGFNGKMKQATRRCSALFENRDLGGDCRPFPCSLSGFWVAIC